MRLSKGRSIDSEGGLINDYEMSGKVGLRD